MKNVILFIYLICFSTVYNKFKSLAPDHDSHVLDFVKLTDGQEVNKIINKLEEEHAKLISNKETHMLMCEKSLNNCRNKFTNKICEINNEDALKEYKEGINDNKELNKDELQMINNLDIVINKTKEDCAELDSILATNEQNFDNDSKFVGNLLNMIKSRAIVLREIEEERIKIEKRMQEERIKNETQKLEEQMKELKDIEERINNTRAEVVDKIAELYKLKEEAEDAAEARASNSSDSKENSISSNSTGNSNANNIARNTSNITETPVGSNTTATSAVTNTTETPVGSNTTATSAVTNTTETPVASNTTATPAVTNTTETPAASNTAATPVASNITEAPVASNTTTSPVASNTTETPTASNTAATPVASNTTETPAASNTTTSPVASNTTETPAASNTAATPVASNTTETPAASNTTNTNITSNKTNAESTNTAQAPAASNTTETSGASNTTVTPVASNTTETPVASNTTETSAASNATETPLASNTTETPVASNTTETPAASNTTETPAASNTTNAESTNNETSTTQNNNSTDTSSNITESISNSTSSNTVNSPASTSKLASFFLQKIKKQQEENAKILNQYSNKFKQPEGGLFTNLLQSFSNFVQGISLIQVSSKMQTEMEMALTTIDDNLNSVTTFKEKMELLDKAESEISLIQENLRRASEELRMSYKDSSDSCKKRLEEYNNKRVEVKKSYLNSKFTLEELKKKISLQESHNKLCEITKKNLKLCNDLSKFCENYQIEFNQEIKELEDLMLYFKQYSDNS